MLLVVKREMVGKLLTLDNDHIIITFSDVFLHVASFLHGDDPGVVLLIDPDQEGLEMVMPDAPSIWPVSGHPRSQQQGRHRLVKQKVILYKKRDTNGCGEVREREAGHKVASYSTCIDQLFLFLLCHPIERVVLPSHLALQPPKGL